MYSLTLEEEWILFSILYDMNFIKIKRLVLVSIISLDLIFASSSRISASYNFSCSKSKCFSFHVRCR